jgi:hypothetical protein
MSKSFLLLFFKKEGLVLLRRILPVGKIRAALA